MATKNVVLKDSNSNELNPQTTITQIKDSSGNALFSVSGTGISTANSYTINGASITDSSITSGKLGNGCFEGIKDSDGHNRFIEGTLTPSSLTGLTITYSRWSLSGTHLMLVVAGELANNTTIVDGFVLGECDNFPDWIRNKIYPSALFGIVEFKDIRFNSTSSWASGTGQVRLRKYNGSLFIDKNNAFTNDKGETLAFRIQFDLLIDMD